MTDANTRTEIATMSQSIFDYFNAFMFSDDLSILAKLLTRHTLMNMIHDVPGDIVECGVYKGAGLASFLKMKRIIFPGASRKKVIGFDYFDSDRLVGSLSGVDREQMAALFERGFKHMPGAQQIVENVLTSAGFIPGRDFELVSGDIAVSAPAFLSERPGFRCSLLYLDVDVEGPTHAALEAFWERIPVGGIVAFDEYGHHQWSEANAVDRFFVGKALRPLSLDTPNGPTAYVRK